jgi:hypothetical protein
MTVPSRREAVDILLSLEPPAWFLRHSCSVAEVAAWLALRASQNGVALDRPLVDAAALLHDLDKLPAPGRAAGGLRHGAGSAAWLAERGHAELGPAIEGHPVTLLADGEWFAEWLRTAGPEALIVAYADKRAGQRLESMADRFGSWERRYPPEERAGRARGGWDSATIEATWRRAEQIELRVCELAGVAPDEVGRLRWTAPLIRAASLVRAAAPGTAGEPAGQARHTAGEVR